MAVIEKKRIVVIRIGDKMTDDAIPLDSIGVYINVWMYASLTAFCKDLGIDKRKIYYLYKKAKKTNTVFQYEKFFILTKRLNRILLEKH